MGAHGSLPPLTALRAFDAAARHLSFTRAAEELHVSQGAISQQVRNLEEWFGLQLFTRQTRNLSLTSEGQQLASVVSSTLLAISETATRIKNRLGEQKVLTVSVMPSLAIGWLIPRLHDFSERHAGITVRVESSTALVDLSGGSVDIAIRFGRGGYKGVYYERIAPEYVIVGGRDEFLPQMNGSEVSVGLSKIPLINYRPLNPEFIHYSWEQAVADLKIKNWSPRFVEEFTHMHLVMQAAIHGHGAALLQITPAGDEILTGRIAALVPRTTLHECSYFFVCREDLSERADILAFKNWISGAMQGYQKRLLAVLDGQTSVVETA